jgi:hypothetical protein
VSFSANRCAYCPRPSFSSQSATCCIAAAPRISGLHPPASARPQRSRRLHALAECGELCDAAACPGEGRPMALQPPSAVLAITICRRQAKCVQHMAWHHQAKKSYREHCCKDHDRDYFLHYATPYALNPPLSFNAPSNLQPVRYARSNEQPCPLVSNFAPPWQFWTSADCNHNFAVVRNFSISGVGVLEEVPMSKATIAGFDTAEILMLAASVLVLAAITFISL